MARVKSPTIDINLIKQNSDRSETNQETSVKVIDQASPIPPSAKPVHINQLTKASTPDEVGGLRPSLFQRRHQTTHDPNPDTNGGPNMAT